MSSQLSKIRERPAPLTSRRGYGVNHVLAQERSVGHKQNIAKGAAQISVKELEKTRMAQQRPTQGGIRECNDCFPLTRFEAIGQQQGGASVLDGQGNLTDGLYFPFRRNGQIDS